MLKKLNWRYGLGELLIVIAGITIAFALNNWAERRNDRASARQYLLNLQTDITADMAEIDSNIATLRGLTAAMENYVPHLFQVLPGRDSIPARIFRKMHVYVYFYPHQATYQSMLNTGDLKLISDFQLKNRIVEHYNSYDRLYKELERQEDFTKNYSAVYFMKEIDHSLLYKNNQAMILDDPYVKNLVFSSMGIIGLQVEAHENARQRCETMLGALAKELGA